MQQVSRINIVVYIILLASAIISTGCEKVQIKWFGFYQYWACAGSRKSAL
jgi:hypothetical protein